MLGRSGVAVAKLTGQLCSYFAGVPIVLSRQDVLLAIVLLTALFWGGCSEPPELAASKTISKKVAQARQLMKDHTEASRSQAQKLLQEALKTPAATNIAKQGAHELLASLLSEINGEELTKLAGAQELFSDADTDLYYTFSQLSTEAASLAYASGLTVRDDQKLKKYRNELAEKTPQAIVDRDNAVRVRRTLEQQLARTERAALATRRAAEGLFLEAEKLGGDEHVRQVSEAAAKRLEADWLSIRAGNEKLAVLSAKEDELARQSALAGLQKAQEHVEQLINTHAGRVNETAQASGDAQATLQEAAEKLLGQLKSFHDKGRKLSEGYEGLIERQGQVVNHYDQALKGAQARSKKFREFKSSQAAEAPLDERVAMLVPLNAEVDLAVSFAQAELVRADLQQELAGVSGRVLSRIKQIEQIRRDLAAVGVTQGSEVIVKTESTGKKQPFDIFRRLLTRAEKEQQRQYPSSAMGIVMASPQIDTAAIDESIERTQKAALANLDSAVGTLWMTALPGRKKLGSAEQAIKGLEKSSWNWQVWGMLGLAHQARAELQQRMSKDEEAKADSQTASIYLAKARETRPDLVRLAGPN